MRGCGMALIGLRVVLALQVSEHASWSTQYYGRIISAALAAVGALHITRTWRS